MLHIFFLLTIPAVTSHTGEYNCFCNFGNHPLMVISGNYQYRGHNSSPQVDSYSSLEQNPSVKVNELQTSLFVKQLLQHLFPGKCLRRHLQHKESLADHFPVSLVGQIGYIYSSKGEEIYRTLCDASTGNPIFRATPTPMTTPASHVQALTEKEYRLQRKERACALPICYDCYCKFGKVTQVIMGLVGKRTVCLVCNLCSVTCNKTVNGTDNIAPMVLPTPVQSSVATTPSLTATPSLTTPPTTLITPGIGSGIMGECVDSVDSCAIHSRSICTEFVKWSRLNCAKFCNMCPTTGNIAPSTRNWLSFGNL